MTSATKGIRKFRALNPQPTKYRSTEAKYGAESYKRTELLAWHKKDARTPISGCELLSEEERVEIMDRVLGGKRKRGIDL